MKRDLRAREALRRRKLTPLVHGMKRAKVLPRRESFYFKTPISLKYRAAPGCKRSDPTFSAVFFAVV